MRWQLGSLSIVAPHGMALFKQNEARLLGALPPLCPKTLFVPTFNGTFTSPSHAENAPPLFISVSFSLSWSVSLSHLYSHHHPLTHATLLPITILPSPPFRCSCVRRVLLPHRLSGMSDSDEFDGAQRPPARRRKIDAGHGGPPADDDPGPAEVRASDVSSTLERDWGWPQIRVIVHRPHGPQWLCTETLSSAVGNGTVVAIVLTHWMLRKSDDMPEARDIGDSAWEMVGPGGQ